MKMLIVGMINTTDEAIELERIARYFMVACRFRKIGKLARKKKAKKEVKK